MPFFPWGVRDLRDDRLDASTRLVEAVIEADRVEGVAEETQMREQPDGSGRPRARAHGHEIAHGVVQRPLRVAVKVCASKPGGRSAPCRPEEEAIEEVRELCEVQIGHENPIAEGVLCRLEPAMAHGADV